MVGRRYASGEGGGHGHSEPSSDIPWYVGRSIPSSLQTRGLALVVGVFGQLGVGLMDDLTGRLELSP